MKRLKLVKYVSILLLVVIFTLAVLHRRLLSNSLTFVDESNERQQRCKESIRTTPERMLTSENTGRLGNQMFAYAALYGIAKHNNRTADIFLSPSMSVYLSNDFKVTGCPTPQEMYKSVNWTSIDISANFSRYKFKVENVISPYVKFRGYPESWKYFDKFRDLIRKEFEFQDHLKAKAEKKLEIAKLLTNVRENVVIVGIHVRRTDYVKSSRRIGIVLPTMEFYNSAMTYFQSKYAKNNVIFIVASDDIPWCVRNFTPLIARTSSESGFRIKFLIPYSSGKLDLAVLANCNHVIFGIGTFGWWGGYLSGGETVFCSDCLLPSGRLIKGFYEDYGNFILPSWIGFTRNGTISKDRVKVEAKSESEFSIG